MRLTLLLITFLFSTQYCFAQDWHPFPFNQKREFVNASNNGYHTYFVDSIEVIPDFGEKHIIGGNYIYNIFGECSDSLFDENALINLPIGTEQFCSAQWSPYHFAQNNSDEFYLINDELGLVLPHWIPSITEFEYDTISFSLNLELLQKDTFYSSLSETFDKIVVTCTEEGNAEIIKGYSDDYKLFSFESFKNDELVDDFNGFEWRLCKNLGLTSFFKPRGFTIDEPIKEMHLASTLINDTHYGRYPNEESFTAPIKVGNIYKWKYKSETYSTYGNGFRRDSVTSIDTVISSVGDTILKINTLYDFSYSTSSESFPNGLVTIQKDKEGSFYMNKENLKVQKNLIIGYYTPTDNPTFFKGALSFSFQENEDFINQNGTGGSSNGGIELQSLVSPDTVNCCLYGGFSSGGKPTYFEKTTFSTISGLYRYHEGSTGGDSYFDATLSLIGFESCDTLFGDVTLVETKEIIPQTIAHLNISPNPSKDIIFINTGSAYQGAAPQMIRIFDINGVEVWSENRTLEESTQLSVAQLNQGIYTVFIKTAEGILTGRFMML